MRLVEVIVLYDGIDTNSGMVDDDISSFDGGKDRSTDGGMADGNGTDSEGINNYGPTDDIGYDGTDGGMVDGYGTTIDVDAIGNSSYML